MTIFCADHQRNPRRQWQLEFELQNSRACILCYCSKLVLTSHFVGFRHCLLFHLSGVWIYNSPCFKWCFALFVMNFVAETLMLYFVSFLYTFATLFICFLIPVNLHVRSKKMFSSLFIKLILQEFYRTLLFSIQHLMPYFVNFPWTDTGTTSRFHTRMIEG